MAINQKILLTGKPAPIGAWMLAGITDDITQAAATGIKAGIAAGMGWPAVGSINPAGGSITPAEKPFYDTMYPAARTLYDNIASKIDPRLADVMMHVCMGYYSDQMDADNQKYEMDNNVMEAVRFPLTQEQKMAKLKAKSDAMSAVQLAQSGALANAATLSPFQIALLANAAGLALAVVQAIAQPSSIPVGANDAQILFEAMEKQRKQRELDDAIEHAKLGKKWGWFVALAAAAVIAYNVGKAKSAA